MMGESFLSESVVPSEDVSSVSQPEMLQSAELIRQNEIVAAAQYGRFKDSILTKVALALIGIITLSAAYSVLFITGNAAAVDWGHDTLRLVLVGALSFVWGASQTNN